MTQQELKFTIFPPAKINLHLSIGGRQSSGFHNLESVFAALDFADALEFSLPPERQSITTVTVREGGVLRELAQKGRPFVPFPMENNIAYLAVELFRKKTGFSHNVTIALTKRVPVGSGLGGGSSDAASTLLALNGLCGGLGPGGGFDKAHAVAVGQSFLPAGQSALSREELLELAAQLGSDVPFFVEIAVPCTEQGEANKASLEREQDTCTAGAWRAASPVRAVSGRGEFFRYLPPPPPLGVLLAFPGFASHTAPAFRLLDEKRPLPAEQGGGAFLGELEDGSFWDSPQNWKFSNDFEALFLNHGTEAERRAYSIILNDIRKAGALYAGLSGSGSACFGVFPSPKAAEQAAQQLAGAFYVLKSTFFLA